MPELRPRSLRAEPEWIEEARAGNPNYETDLARAEGLLALTEYPQWELFHNQMEQLRQEAVDRILDPYTQKMEVVAAYRARARVLAWLMDTPNRARTDRDTLLEVEQAAKEEEDAE